MFTLAHIFWLVVCFLGAFAAFWYLLKYKPSLQKVLSVACVGCVISELVKTFSVLQMVPSADGSTMHLYLEMHHLPFHLCSIQIAMIFFARFSKNEKLRETVLAFMYPTCTIGAFLAIMMPSIFTADTTVVDAFLHSHPYQYFLYHAMLVVLGMYIALSKEVNIQPKHYLSTMGILGTMAFISIYLNSMFAVPTYENGQLVSVDFSTNFFFTQETPLNIPLTQMWHWFVYLAVILALGVTLIGLFYYPYIRKAKKQKQEMTKA